MKASQFVMMIHLDVFGFQESYIILYRQCYTRWPGIRDAEGIQHALVVWLYVLVMSRTRFRVNPHSIVVWMSRNSLLEAGAKSEG